MDTNILPALQAANGLLLSALLVGAVLVLAAISRVSLKRGLNVDPAEVQERLDAGMELLVLDVRPVVEFDRGHVAGAVNIPEAGLRGRLDDPACALPADLDGTIAVIAGSAAAAERCAGHLRRAGYRRVRVVAGGMRGWCEDRLPLARSDGIATAAPRR